MSTLRQRKDASSSGSSNANFASQSSHDPIQPDEDDDDAPRVPQASSAFETHDHAADPASPTASSSSSPSSSPAGPAEQEMTAQIEHKGQSLNITPELRAVFQKRKDELLKKYPDLLNRDITGDPTTHTDDPPAPCRFDLVVILVLSALACYLLYLEYGINIPLGIGNFFQRLLDPGPIQYEPAEENVGKAAVEAAVRHVQERMRNAKT